MSDTAILPVITPVESCEGDVVVNLLHVEHLRLSASAHAAYPQPHFGMKPLKRRAHRVWRVPAWLRTWRSSENWGTW